MRLLYLSAAGEIGGAERMLLDLADEVRQARPSWALQLIAPADGPLAAAASQLGLACRVVRAPERFARLGEAGALERAGGQLRIGAGLAAAAVPLASFVARLRRAVGAFQPDIVHSHGLKMHLPGAWTAGRAAVVWHLHDYVTPRAVSARLLRWNARFCAAAIAPSRSVADDARETLGARVRTVLNGVDLRRFSASGARLDLDALAGLPPAPPGTVRVGLVATFARWKGQGAFLDALAQLPAGTPPVRGYVIGGPLYRTAGSQFSLDELRRHAERAGLAGRVGFTGHAIRADEAIRALDVVVHASTAREPFGLAIAEAMACGRAVVASNAGGAAELVSPGVDGLVHTAGDVHGLAERIAELARDGATRARLGAAARRAAERRFDRRRMAAEMLGVYEEIAG